MGVIDMRMEQRRNERAGETGNPRENPPTNGIVRHDSHMRESGVTRPRYFEIPVKTVVITYTRRKAKKKYRNRIRLEKASLKQSSDTHNTPYDVVKRCREYRKNSKASELVNVDIGPEECTAEEIALLARFLCLICGQNRCRRYHITALLSSSLARDAKPTSAARTSDTGMHKYTTNSMRQNRGVVVVVEVSLDRRTNKATRPMTTLILHKAEEYTTCTQADPKPGFRSAHFNANSL
ncbi:hypothetical protein PR048_027542 [Dryococelus australis]|uniref:Uncharacterized protein n=1 Tax=Dryococelus australis TaxID=614101 RepID=A0ABQ9GGV2_9NEOP|nr:hypothetical protein PR048_027542 [Dryococelus australis]